MADKANWEGVSITEDNEVIAEGGFIGIIGGASTLYTSSGAISTKDSFAIIDATSNPCDMTLADGIEGQVISIKAINVSNQCTVDFLNSYDSDPVVFVSENSSVTTSFSNGKWGIIASFGTLG